MTRWKSRKKAIVLSALLLVLGVVGFGAVAPVQAAGDPTDLVPKDCFFCVRINSLDNALGQVDMFLTGLFPVGVSMMAKMQLGQFLGSPQPQGIDMAGGFAIFSPIPGSPDPTALGILVPVSNYQTFVSQNANVSAADAQGLSKVGVAGGPMLVAKEFAGYALLSLPGKEQALLAVAKPTAALSADLDPAESKRATTAPIWAFGNLQSIGQTFGPMIKAQLGQMKEMMAPGQGPEADAANEGLAALDSLFKEGKYISLALTPSADKISLGAVVAAVPGSEMAQSLKAREGQPNAKLTACLSDGACLNVLGMDTPLGKGLRASLNEEIEKKLGQDDSADPEMKQVQAILKNLLACAEGSVAVSVAPNASAKPPVSIQSVSELKDPQKFRTLVDTAVKLLTPELLEEFTQETGMKMAVDVKEKAKTYKGVAIDAIKVNLTPTDATAPEAEQIKSIVGDGLNIQTAATDGMLALALSEDPTPTLQGLIDKVKGGSSSPASSEVQAAMKLIPGSEQADLFVTINIIRVLQIAKAVAPNEIPLPAGALPTQSNVALAGAVKDGKATLDLAVPKQHVQEIMMIAMQMQQGM